MRRKWLGKLGVPLFAFMLTVACSSPNNDKEPREQPGTEKPGDNNQDNGGQNQDPNNMDSENIDWNHDKYEGYQ